MDGKLASFWCETPNPASNQGPGEFVDVGFVAMFFIYFFLDMYVWHVAYIHHET